jgi:hypothetical protein
MSALTLKLKKIYLPFVLASASVLFIYGFFRWYFDVYTGPLWIQEDLLDYFIPLFLTMMVSFLLLGKRVKKYIRRTRDHRGRLSLQLIMGLGMLIPVATSQHYIKHALFPLNDIQSIEEVREMRKEKYFKLRQIQVDKSQCQAYREVRQNGGKTRKTHFDAYYVCPLVESNEIWMGVQYHHEEMGASEKQARKAEGYFKTTNRFFEERNLQEFQYLKLLRPSKERNKFVDFIESFQPGVEKKALFILTPQMRVYESRPGTELYLVVVAFLMSMLGIFVILLFYKTNPMVDK